MGCVCCSVSSFISIFLDALERITLCTVCALLTCCLLFTILTVLILGIGIGYHYCFVANSVEAMEKAAKAGGALRTGLRPDSSGNVMRSVNKAVKRGIAHRVARRDADTIPSSNNTHNALYPQNYTLSNDTHRLVTRPSYASFNGTNFTTLSL
ncbi:uncharacterized protein LOC142977987 [Anticarsia gemmatalis]|uniref:uncharacterized protein LOC142977987 n=1 Tax=Anticarsia gemmatalis TaxID=129554 RepID=UPI003F75D3B8